MKLIKSLSALCLLAFACLACNDKFDNPERFSATTIDSSKIISIKDLKALKTLHSPDAAYKLTDETYADLYIAGKVISNDQDGNLYRQLFIQDETSGICVKIGKSGLYNFYKPGQTVYVKIQNLTLGQYGGMVELGYQTPQGSRYETAYIDVPYLIQEHILAGEKGTATEPVVVTTSSMKDNPDLLGTLVKFENVKFSKTSGTTPVVTHSGIPTWAVPASDPMAITAGSPITVSQDFTDAHGTIVVRTSGYSRFAGRTMPTGSVDLIGILTIYGSTYQLTLRDMNDVVE